jgi:hypothetical protein
LRRYPLGFANGSCNTRVFGTISMGRIERDKTRANLMNQQMFTLLGTIYDIIITIYSFAKVAFFFSIVAWMATAGSGA